MSTKDFIVKSRWAQRERRKDLCTQRRTRPRHVHAKGDKTKTCARKGGQDQVMCTKTTYRELRIIGGMPEALPALGGHGLRARRVDDQTTRRQPADKIVARKLLLLLRHLFHVRACVCWLANCVARVRFESRSLCSSKGDVGGMRCASACNAIESGDIPRE